MRNNNGEGSRDTNVLVYQSRQNTSTSQQLQPTITAARAFFNYNTQKINLRLRTHKLLNYPNTK